MRALGTIVLIIVVIVVIYLLIGNNGVNSPLFNQRDVSAFNAGNPGGNGGSDPAATETPQKYTLAGNTTAVPGQSPRTTPPDGFVCQDGKELMNMAATIGGLLPRLPIGASWQRNIVEVSWPNPVGFGGIERGIIVVPQVGEVWETNISNTTTVHVMGFCDYINVVQNWALNKHVPSLRQASQAPNGTRPDLGEIGVYTLNYEARTLTTVKRGLDGQGNRLLALLDVSFHQQNGDINNVPITLR